MGEQAAWQLGLERMLLVPTGVAPHKPIEPEPGPEVRLRLAEAAVVGEELFEVCGYEVEKALAVGVPGADDATREGVSYTCETLEWLRREHPGDELWLLLGADAAVGLPSWRFPHEVVEMARLAIATRPGVEESEIRESLDRVRKGLEWEAIEIPALEISSTAIRERARAGMPLSHLVPDAVATMITAGSIYGEGDDDE